ncbi:MAG: methyltransferase domain-containing protein [Magnetospirillum sp.]|nr:methyltransferase domain-containing protein [Magnetospirillum sp.]
MQRIAAERLAERVARLPLPPRPRVLEIGCGTGLPQPRPARADRTGGLAAHRPVAGHAGRAAAPPPLGDPPDADFRLLDGEQPDLDGPFDLPFDLIVSSLAVQWFRDPAAALARWAGLLAPGGRIAVATLAADSFREWREAHHELGLEAGTPAYPPPAATVDGLWPAGGVRIGRGGAAAPPPRRRAGVPRRRLKGIGAHLPAEGRRPLPPGALRRVLRRLERPEGLTMTHHIAYGLFRKDGTRPRTGCSSPAPTRASARRWSPRALCGPGTPPIGSRCKPA